MALTGDSLKATPAANAGANRQAMVTMSGTLATPLKERSAEDQAHMGTLLQKMQDCINK